MKTFIFSEKGEKNPKPNTRNKKEQTRENLSKENFVCRCHIEDIINISLISSLHPAHVI